MTHSTLSQSLRLASLYINVFPPNVRYSFDYQGRTFYVHAVAPDLHAFRQIGAVLHVHPRTSKQTIRKRIRSLIITVTLATP